MHNPPRTNEEGPLRKHTYNRAPAGPENITPPFLLSADLRAEMARQASHPRISQAQ